MSATATGPLAGWGPGEWTALLIAVIASLGTSGGIGSWIAVRRAKRQGVSADEAEARKQERDDRAAADKRAQERTDNELARLSLSLTNALSEIEELREAVRQQFAREEHQRTILMHHATWDWIVVQEVRRHGITVEDPPPLTPPPPGHAPRPEAAT